MKGLLKSTVCVIALLGTAVPAAAQEQTPASASLPAAPEPQDSGPAPVAPGQDPVAPGQDIVVVGSRTNVKEIRSSNAITLFNEEKLNDLAPASVGALVRSIPGFHAEDSGGEVGNNIAPRGFPLSTQMEFTALQRDGMVVFYDQDILFSQADRFTRFSNFVANAQAVRG